MFACECFCAREIFHKKKTWNCPNNLIWLYDSEPGQVLASEWKNGGSSRLFEW